MASGDGSTAEATVLVDLPVSRSLYLDGEQPRHLGRLLTEGSVEQLHVFGRALLELGREAAL